MIINKTQLIDKMMNATKRIRILGVLPFDINWDEFKVLWFNKINAKELSIEIIREAEHFVNAQSIIASDKRISGEERIYELGSFLNIFAAPESNLRKYLLDESCKYLEPESDVKSKEENYKQRFSLRTCYLPIPIPAINIDEEYFVTFALTKFNAMDKFEKIDENHNWNLEFMRYFKAYFDNEGGVKKYSTELTSKGNRLEVIQSYDEKRMPTGLLPRDSFLNTTQVKAVVWALLFTRDGKLLIHKRSSNAKDNQNMWDKSVGGHIDIKDIDSAKAVGRELGEELFTVEKDIQGGYGETDFVKVNQDKMIFLGEWLPKRRYTMPFKDVARDPDEYYYFRMDYPFSSKPINSMRILPDKKEQDVFVFADVYVCIAPEKFQNLISSKKLKNSKYELIELHELKEAFYDKKFANKDFLPSPDIKTIIRSSLWDDLASFSDYLKGYFKKNSKIRDDKIL